MSPVLCDPKSRVVDFESEVAPRKRSRAAVGLLLWTLLAATPLVITDGDRIAAHWLRERILQTPSVVAAQEVAEPATSLLTGNSKPLQSLINRQRASRIIIFSSLGICLGLYLMLRE
ncbi:MAG: hypothetical protein K1X74_21550 [Pirellulales bacterium]|nr:hypothetical protein [Pirellulales bacterium]